MRKIRFYLIGILVCLAAPLFAQDSKSQSPDAVASFIDQQMAATWKAERITPSNPCLDHEFLRRACLDIVGVIPAEKAVKQFLADNKRNKRELLVDELLKTETYSRYAAVTWSNLLVGRGTGAESLLHARFRDWLYEQFRTDKGFDQITRKILTATGTALDQPAVVWALHHDTKPENLTGAASRVFLGRQIQCAQCHDHPFEERTQEEFYGMAAFFARAVETQVLFVQRVSDANSGEVRLGGLPSGKIVPPQFTDGSKPVRSRYSRREQLANWMVDPNNKQFAKAIVNRVWSWMLGRGLVDPVDDFSPTNSAVYPAVLQRLADGFIHSGYDMKFLVRTISRTRAYQLSSRPSRNNKDDETFFSKAAIRRLNPEQMVASVVMSTGLVNDEKTWDNPIFRLLLQAVLNDFIFVFDNMDETTEVSEFRGTIAQALMMMNSKHITNTTKLNLLSPMFRKLAACRTVNEKIDLLFRVTLSRSPTNSELRRFGQYFQDAKRSSDQLMVCEDLYWALLNCNEFTFNY